MKRRYTKLQTALLAGILLLGSGCEETQLDSVTYGVDLHDQPGNPFSAESGITVLVFVACDCPISNRYIPTIRKLSQQYLQQRVTFWLVYPDADTSTEQIRQHVRDYDPQLPILRDPRHELVRVARVTTVPEAAVFLREGRRLRLAYHGGIDNRYVDFGVARPQPTESYLRDVLESTLAGRPGPFRSMPAVGCPIPAE